MVEIEYIETGYHNDLGGAEMCHYDVKPKEKCTLLEFILSVLKIRDYNFGDFRVQNSRNCVEFIKGGSVTSNSFTQDELHSIVKSVTAMGAYGIMHYRIVLEDK